MSPLNPNISISMQYAMTNFSVRIGQWIFIAVADGRTDVIRVTLP